VEGNGFFVCMFRQKGYDRWCTHGIPLWVQRTPAAELYFLGCGLATKSTTSAEQIFDLRLGVGREQSEADDQSLSKPKVCECGLPRRGGLSRGGLSAQPAILAEQVFEGNLRARLCLAIAGWTLKADDLSGASRGGNILRFLDLE